VPPALSDIIARPRQDPAARYQTADDMRDALERSANLRQSD
jgi:hypothetical protein